jgi:hypothetical protein
LPCVPLAAHGKEVFAVRCLTAMIGRTAAPDFPVVSRPIGSNITRSSIIPNNQSIDHSGDNINNNVDT